MPAGSATEHGRFYTEDTLLEHSIDQGASWIPLATYVQFTGSVQRDVKTITPDTPFGSRLRLNITAVGGTTPSFPTVTLVVASQSHEG